MDKIQAQANLIFRMLASSEQVVVLLDEIDELVRERSSAPEVYSRFLTTAMLPKLQDIHDSGNVVFLVATNYVEAFDTAIMRPGRFDFILKVGPPTASEKLANSPIFARKASKLGMSRRLLKERIQDLTYAEFLQLAKKAAQANSKRRFTQLLEEGQRDCTMNQPKGGGETDSWDAGITWKDWFKESASRLPLEANNE